MKIRDIINVIEQLAPLSLQESYDNSGVQTGNVNQEAKGALLCIDVTESVIDEAITLECNMIISHHPLVFRPMKSIIGKNCIERCMIKAIKHDLVIYASHTNLDNAQNGINAHLANMLGLQNIRILSPMRDMLTKVVVFVPLAHSETVRSAIFNAGGGHIGNYDCCSYYSQGMGTFRASENASPYVGHKHIIHQEPEVKIETIVPNFKIKDVIGAILSTHPYEEPAYDCIPLNNAWHQNGGGIVGTLKEELSEENFLYLVKETFNLQMLSHSVTSGKIIKDVAICSGSGNGFIHNAINYGADAYITGEVKYNDYYDVEGKLLLTVIGHYESEIYTKKVFYDLISKIFPTFALYMAGSDQNPVKYL